MAEIQLSPEAIKLHKERMGYTDEELKNTTPNQRMIMNAAVNFQKYNIIAECVWARGCYWQPKPGDKFVIRAGGRLVPEESTFPTMCIAAISQFLPFLHIVYERLALGLDPTPEGLNSVRCFDTGIENGGYGQVLFKIRCEKVSS